MFSISEEEKKYVMIALQILSFIFLILPGVMQFDLPHFIFPFIILEIVVFIPIFFKKEMKYFFLIWQFQLFLLIFLSLYYRPLSTLNINNVADTALYTLFFLLILIEVLICSYILFGELIIKKLLLGLSTTTTLVVFLIVIFIISEGAPAFQETHPVDFITGNDWDPFYSRGSSVHADFNTVAKSYDFDIFMGDEKIYFTYSDQKNVSIWITNTGGATDELFFTIDHEGLLNHTLNDNSALLDPGESKELIMCLNVPYEGEYDITVHGYSNNSDVQRSKQFTAVRSDHGVDFSPDIQYLRGDETNSGYVYSNIDIANPGLDENDFIISVDNMEDFRPSITSDRIDWNHTSGTGTVTLDANETITAKFTPRLINNILGEHTINATIRSVSNPGISDRASLVFTHVFEELMIVDKTQESITPMDTANYTIITSGNGTNVDVIIEDVPEGWEVRLMYKGKDVLDNEGKTTLGENITGKVVLNLLVSGEGLQEGDSSKIRFTLKKGASEPIFGILPFILGTIITSAIAVAIAAPLGVGCAIYLSEYSPPSIKKFLRPLFELLAGIPSVIYGLWGFLTLGPLLGKRIYPHFGVEPGIGRNMMTASLVLSIMILPIIIALSADAISSVRKELRDASFSMGTTRWQTIKSVILPCAKSGIISSIILGTGRAIGETMAVVMIMGSSSNIPQSVFDPVGTMTSVIAVTFGWSFSYDKTRHAIFAIATILFFMVFALNIIVYKMQHRKKKEKGSRISNLIMKVTDKVKNSLPSNSKENNLIVNESDIRHDKLNDLKSKFKIPTLAVKREKHVKYLLVAGSALVTIVLFFIIGDIIYRGGTNIQLNFFFEREYMGGKGGGFVNAITGSLSLVAIALGVATPLSVGSALYVQEYAKENNIIKRIVLFTSDTLASTPSIVFGAFGFMFFVLYLEFGFSMIAGGFTLGFMIIPILLRSSIEALKSVPQSYRNASLALGATKWQTIKKVVIPPSLPSISSGLIISVGRAIGETAAILLTAGYASHVATSIMHQTASMPNMIYQYYSISGRWPTLAAKVYSSAMVLIIMVLVLNGVSKLIRYKYSDMLENN